MSNICIVCEFNPLHNGHEYLLRKARALGADTVTCVMSGNSTQRGDLALTDKYNRAEAAIKCGADLVLELPFPWSSASADYFATAAVYIAAGFGDKLLFGSECGDMELLCRAADICERDDFKEKYAQRTSGGEGAAASFLSYLADNGIEDLSSNDLLGIAYIRAIKRLDVDLEPITVKRNGAEYNSDEITENGYQSATAIRTKISDGEPVLGYVPDTMSQILTIEAQLGRLTDMKELDSAVLGFFRLSDAQGLDDIADAGGGIANRLIAAAHNSTSYSEMFDNVRTKRYTDAKLRRAILFCMTGVHSDDIERLPEYTTLLAANDKGRGLLSINRKTHNVKVVTKPADTPECTQTILSNKLDALYGLARKNKLPSDYFVKKSAYIEK